MTVPVSPVPLAQWVSGQADRAEARLHSPCLPAPQPPPRRLPVMSLNCVHQPPPPRRGTNADPGPHPHPLKPSTLPTEFLRVLKLEAGWALTPTAAFLRLCTVSASERGRHHQPCLTGGPAAQSGLLVPKALRGSGPARLGLSPHQRSVRQRSALLGFGRSTAATPECLNRLPLHLPPSPAFTAGDPGNAAAVAGAEKERPA